MLIYNIPIIGIIGSKPEGDASNDRYFSYTDLLLHLQAAKNYPAINLVIDSVGGYCDVADKMVDALRITGKMIFAENAGDVMSAALTLFLTAPKQNRKFNPKKGDMLPHFPWGVAEGEADQIAEYAKDLKRTESYYVSLYAEMTGVDKEIMQGIMAENTVLTVEQIEAFGFAKIINPEINAMAFFKQLNNSDKMDVKQFEMQSKKTQSTLDKLMKFLGFRMIVLTDATGNELDFGDIKDEAEIVAGVPVTVAGNPASGEYIMPDGKVYVCENGLLTEIKMPEPDEIELLKAENEKLKAEIGSKNTEAQTAQAALLAKENELIQFKAEATKQVETVNAEFASFKAQFKPLENPINTPSNKNEGEKKMFVKLKTRE